MKSIFFSLLLIAFFIHTSCHSKIVPQQTVNRQITDSKGNQVLLGRCTKERLQQEPYGAWYNKNYADYSVDTADAKKLKHRLQGKKFVIFMGTWCGDSKREVPRMFKLLDYCGVKSSNVQLIMLSNQDSLYKQSPGHEEMGLNIHRVPDLLVYEKNMEIGRIVESPVSSLEKDLLSITGHEGYAPNYQVVSFIINLFQEKALTAIDGHVADWANQMKPIAKSASELNTYGHVLMAAKEMDKAGIVFKINTLLYPANAAVFDSYGNYYMKSGNRLLAMENYHKTLEIEPTNENAKKMLEQLENK